MVAFVALACWILVVLALDLHGHCGRARSLDPRGLHCVRGHVLGGLWVCFRRRAFFMKVLRAGVLDLHGRLMLTRRQVNLENFEF